MGFRQSITRYTASILIALCAVIIAFTGSLGFAVAGIFLAFVTFMNTRQLLQKLAAANEQTCFLDEKLVQSQKLASIGELSAGIGHEINNPLAIISQETEWMQHLLKQIGERDPKEVAELQDSLKEVLRQVDRCREITQNLLRAPRGSPEWADLVAGLTVYAWQEPDEGGAQFVARVGDSLPDL